MHKKFSKGIAAVMSAALVLGSVVTGVVPANAATSVQAESGLYETTYNMSELEIEGNKSWGRPSNTEVQGTSVSLTFSAAWSAEFFTIPAEVIAAGFKGAKITYTEPNANIGIKLGGDHDFGWDILVAEGQTEITTIPDKIVTVPNGTPVPDGTRYENYQNDRTEEHIKYITAIGIVQTGSDGCTVVAESITFLTENPAGDVETPEDPTTPGTDVTDPSTGNTDTSTKTEKGYETAYTLADFGEPFYQADTATIDGNKIDWTNHWGNIFFKIPQEIMDAGLIGFYCTGTIEGTEGVDLKIANSDDLWGSALVDKYTTTFDDAIAEITPDQRATANLFAIMSLGAEGESMSATVDSIIFITENAIGGGTEDPGTTDPGTEDPGTTDPTPAKLDKAKITSATAAKKKVTLKWDNVDNSTAYKVYRATSKKGTYKLVKTVKKTTYTDKKLKAGTKYFYKVQAVNKDTGAKGAKSAAKNVTTKK